MKESNNQYPVPSIQVTNASSSSRMEKGRNLLRVLKNPPQPHMCIQDSLVKSSTPCFVNVLSWSKLSSPTNPLDPIPLYGGMRVVNHSTNALKLTISSYSQNSSLHPDVFAVMAHPEVLRVSGKKCKDIKDRDAFIDLMLDFVEAMNPGIKFKRKFVVLEDRDLAGELKDIWFTVHNKRQREKMNHSSHSEGDISCFSNKRSPDNTTVRISKQTTKSMAQLSVQELCAAVDVALVDSSNSGSNNIPSSWLFHRHFSENTNSSDNITCCREIDHEESLVGWNSGNNRGGLFNLSMQPLFPVNLNPSLSSSSASDSEASSAFPFSEKKTLEEDCQVGQTSNFKPYNATRVGGEEPPPKELPNVYIIRDSTSACDGSEILVPFDDDEDKSLFGFPANRQKTNLPIEALYAYEEQKNLTRNKSLSVIETNQLDIISLDDLQHKILTHDLSEYLCNINQSAIVLHDGTNQGIVTDEVHERNQSAMVLCDDTNQEIVAGDQPQNVHESNESAIVLFGDTNQEIVAYNQPQTEHESNQPAVLLSDGTNIDIVADDMPQTVHEMDQPDTVLLCVTYDQSGTITKSSQPTMVLCNYIEERNVVYDKSSADPGSSQPITIDVLCDDTVQLITNWDPYLASSNIATEELPVPKKEDIVTGSKTVSAPWPMEMTYTSSVLQTNQTVDGKISGDILESERCDHTFDNQTSVFCEECSGEDKENNGSKYVKTPLRMADLSDCGIHVKEKNNLAGNCETCPKEQDSYNNNFYDNGGSLLQNDSLCNTVTANLLGIKQNEELLYVSSSDGLNGTVLDTSVKHPYDLSMPFTTISESTAAISHECTKNPLDIAKVDRSTEGALAVPPGSKATEIDLVVHSKLSKDPDPIASLNDVLPCSSVDEKTKQGNSHAKVDSTNVEKHKPLVRSLSQGDCNLSGVACFAHAIENNSGVQKINKDALSLGSVVSQPSLPATGKSNARSGRKGYNTKSCKETVPHPGNNNKRPSSSAAAVSERSKANVSPARQQCKPNEPVTPRHPSPVNSRPLNVAGRQRRQGTQNSAPVRPSVINNTTILQSFGVLVPRENAPRRPRRSKGAETSSAPSPSPTGLSGGGGEGRVDQCAKKSPAQKHNASSADSPKNKSRSVCDRNSRASRRSLCENDKPDASQLSVVGANFNPSESGNIPSAVNGSLSSVSLKNAVCPEPKARKGFNSKARTGSAHELSKHNSHFSKSKITKVNPNSSSDSDLKNIGSTSQLLDVTEIVNARILKEADSSLFYSEGNLAEVVYQERGENSMSRSEENSQCSTVFVEFLPSLETVALLSENVDTGLSSCKDHPAFGEVVMEGAFLIEKSESISTDSSGNPSRNAIINVEDNCPETKTEFKSHQDSISCGSATNSSCTNALGHPRNESDLESNS